MANNVTLPGTGKVIETIDVGGGIERQVTTIAPRDGSNADSIGTLNETPPATDTAPAGLNGRLQRIAQRLTPSTITWTQELVTLAAATSSTLVAANANRKGLRWMVTGTNPMTVSPGAVTVSAGSGMNYNPSSGAGFQGGSDNFDYPASTQAFSAISTGGTTVTVWEGV